MSTSTMTRGFVIGVTAAWLGVYGAKTLAAKAQQAPTSKPDSSGQTTRVNNDDLETLHVQKDVYLIAGAGANITVQVGPEGLVVVDTGDGLKNEQVLAAIRRLSPVPIRFIINTSDDSDHTGGNQAVAQAGSAFRTRSSFYDGAEVVAHENVLKRMSTQTPGRPMLPEAAWPTSTYFVPEKDLHHNGEAILVLYQPAAHTNGDSAVYFRSSEVLVAGDVFDLSRYPVVDKGRGGTATGVINALNRLLDIAVAGNYEEGGTMIIPGHGHICDEADLVEYRDMATIIRDRVQDMVKNGRTLEQVKEAKPSLEYDAIYGSPDALVEALYRDLAAPRPAAVKRNTK